MFDILHYEFMRNALLAGVLVSVACGVVGSLVVVNRLSSLSGGVAHAAYGGLGLAVFFRWPLLAGRHALFARRLGRDGLGDRATRRSAPTPSWAWCGRSAWRSASS